MGEGLIRLAWAALWLRSPFECVLAKGSALRPYHPVGVCLICLACAALWLQSPYGRVLNMFGMGRPMAAVSLWACA